MNKLVDVMGVATMSRCVLFSFVQKNRFPRNPRKDYWKKFFTGVAFSGH